MIWGESRADFQWSHAISNSKGLIEFRIPTKPSIISAIFAWIILRCFTSEFLLLRKTNEILSILWSIVNFNTNVFDPLSLVWNAKTTTLLSIHWGPGAPELVSFFFRFRYQNRLCSYYKLKLRSSLCLIRRSSIRTMNASERLLGIVEIFPALWWPTHSGGDKHMQVVSWNFCEIKMTGRGE